jgi:ABC-type nickel/cobalt efflux system permease component RcnA
MVVRPSPGTIHAAWPELLADPSLELTVFPDEWINFPPYIDDIAFMWEAGSGQRADSGPEATAIDADPVAVPGGRLEQLFANDRGSGFVVVAMLLALVFGALEALGPGHAKTTVATYVASSGAGIADAVKVGLLAAAAHSLVVYTIGAVVLISSAFLLPAQAEAWMPLASGVLIVGVGLFLLRQARRGHSHHRRGGNMVVGIAGGLVPCPSSTLVMVAAVALGKVLWGMALIAAFSLGTALVLVAIGIVVVAGSQYGQRTIERSALQRAMVLAPVLGALLVIAVGTFVSVRSLERITDDASRFSAASVEAAGDD